MRRLASISQLGMVALVYPGATHSRLEHSLGVYHNALRLLARFDGDPPFTSLVDQRWSEAFVVAALVHDVGHWPFCHPIEDMQLQDLGEHESRVRHWLQTPELADCIHEDWSCDIDDVLALLEPKSFGSDDSHADARAFLASCLSGPVDVDKLDYLQRDSLHAGVPYGHNFDAGRLISSMCVNPEQCRLAVGEKGRTAAEMMVFARYVMFSEVYWHHAVRSATAMLQRAVFLLQNRVDLQGSLKLDDAAWVAMLRRAADGSVAEPLVDGLFGPRRHLYKRVAEFNVLNQPTDVHAKLARRPYWWLVACAEKLAELLASRCSLAVHAADVLIDAPPAKLEVDINVDVVSRDGSVHGLGEVSPVASALANHQFDNQVKRVRVFVSPGLRAGLQSHIQTPDDWAAIILEAVDALSSEFA